MSSPSGPRKTPSAKLLPPPRPLWEVILAPIVPNRIQITKPITRVVSVWSCPVCVDGLVVPHFGGVGIFELVV